VINKQGNHWYHFKVFGMTSRIYKSELLHIICMYLNVWLLGTRPSLIHYYTNSLIFDEHENEFTIALWSCRTHHYGAFDRLSLQWTYIKKENKEENCTFEGVKRKTLRTCFQYVAVHHILVSVFIIRLRFYWRLLL